MALGQTWMLGAAEGDDDVTYTAREIRLPTDALVSTQGVCGPDDYRVVQRAAGANMSVDVGAGSAVVTGATAAQRKYIQPNDATVNVDGFAAPSSGTLHYLIYLQVHDKQLGAGADYTPQLAITSAATLPATPSNAIPLADVTVAAGQASITTADIVDLRPRATSIPALDAYAEFYSQQNPSTGNAIPRQQQILYRPAGVRYTKAFTVGTHILDATKGQIDSIPFTGLWGVYACHRSHHIGPAELMVKRTSAALGEIRIPAAGSQGGNAAADTTLATLFGVIPCQRGDTLGCYYYQDAVTQTHLYDPNNEIAFRVWYVGPLPGIVGLS